MYAEPVPGPEYHELGISSICVFLHIGSRPICSLGPGGQPGRVIAMVGLKDSITRASLASGFQCGSSNGKHNGERRDVSRIYFSSNINRPGST